MVCDVAKQDGWWKVYANLSLRDVMLAFCVFSLILLREPVAQLVEHRTFNAVVAGSSPARLTIIFNKLVRSHCPAALASLCI